MGSTLIWNLEVKESFVFIAKHNKNAQVSIANEKSAKNGHVSISQVLKIKYPEQISEELIKNLFGPKK